MLYAFIQQTMGEFSAYTIDSDPLVAAAARALEVATSQLKTGQITRGEFNKKIVDILDFDVVAANITDKQRRRHILLAFETMAIMAEDIRQ